MAQPPPYQIQALLEKLTNPDSDFRFMSLNDLYTILSNNTGTTLTGDPNLAIRVVDGVIKALDDANGEVQNLAVKCLGPLVLKVKDAQIASIVERLSLLALTSTDPSIPCTALRTVISHLPRPTGAVNAQASNSQQLATQPAAVQAAVQAVRAMLVPKLLTMLAPDAQKGTSIDAVDVLIEVLRNFGITLSGADVEQFQVHVMGILENDRSTGVVKKRAVTSLSLLCVYAPDILLSSFITHLIQMFRIEGQSPQRIRLLTSITGALARAIPDRFGPHLRIVAPFILSLVDGHDLEDREIGDEPNLEEDEVKETALVSLEAFQTMCTKEMKRFTEEVIAAGSRFLKYDPNYADAEDDEEMGGTQDEDDEEEGFDDEDFEEEGNFSDEDDISWKVRRCAAKLLSAVIRTRAGDLLEDGTIYKEVAPLLVERFNEREENVRLEVLSTINLLVRKTGEITAPVPIAPPVMSNKKRRRESSDATIQRPIQPGPVTAPKTGPRSSLAQLVPRISKAVSRLLRAKKESISTKQAAVVLLLSIVSVLHGGLEDTLSLFVEPIIDMAKGGTTYLSGSSHTTGGVSIAGASAAGIAATATGSSLRIEILRLIAAICEQHRPETTQTYFKDLVPAVVASVRERFYKISSEALLTCVQLINVLTTQIARGNEYLDLIYDAIVEKVTAVDTDLEVRERAIYALGVLLSRTSGSAAEISAAKRQTGLDILLDRLRNETTRIVAARAIDSIAKNAKSTTDLSETWVRQVVIELGAQLRKANRSLRGASLDGLKSIVSNKYGRDLLDHGAQMDLMTVLTPLLTVNDLHLLGPALAIMTLLVQTEKVPVTPAIIDAICSLVKVPIGSGTTLDNLVAFVNTIGRTGQGKSQLMDKLLRDVGVNGDTAVVAKVIGHLLVTGGGKEGGLPVGLQEFVREANSTDDDKRKCLALMVLGEAGLKMGSSFPIKPDTFLRHFSAKSDEVPIAAAVALGLAGAGNVQAYLPVIMSQLGQGDKEKDQYLLLHSLKEIIEHSEESAANIKPFAKQIWNALFTTTKSDDSKAVGAECVGRMTIIDPYSFLPELQQHLASSDSSVRGMVISAIRYTFTDTLASYDDLLRPIVVDFLTVMVEDQELDNRRLALTALNSAAHNKPHLIMPHLEKLLPLVYRESVIRPELVREVQMGPFKHKVDDGLEVRKSAYETLYALLETSFSGINPIDFFQRVIAGLEDEHDIRVLCNLMLGKLTILARDETIARVDDVGDKFRITLSSKPKDTAVKQELEKHAELVRSTLRASLAINRECAAALMGDTPGRRGKKWLDYWTWAKTMFANEIKALEMEDAVAGGMMGHDVY